MILLSLQYFQVIDIANIDKRVWTEVKIKIVIVDFWEFLSANYQKESDQEGKHRSIVYDPLLNETGPFPIDVAADWLH